jgi:hypothetical protein
MFFLKILDFKETKNISTNETEKEKRKIIIPYQRVATQPTQPYLGVRRPASDDQVGVERRPSWAAWLENPRRFWDGFPYFLLISAPEHAIS